jgi:hypothetical protein
MQTISTIMALAATTMPVTLPALHDFAKIMDPVQAALLVACAVIGFMGGLAREFKEHQGEFQKHQITGSFGSAFTAFIAGSLALAYTSLPALILFPIAGYAGWKGTDLLDPSFSWLAGRLPGGLGDLIPQNKQQVEARAAAAPAPRPTASTPVDLAGVSL